MPLYDEKGNIIGRAPQAPQQQDAGFLGNLLNSIVDPVSRLGRGISTLTSNRLGTGRNYLDEAENKAYQNPLNIAKDVASVGSLLLPGGGIKGAITSGALGSFGGTYGEDDLVKTLTGTATGAVTGGVLGAAGKGVQKLANRGAAKAAGKIAPEVSNVADRVTKLNTAVDEIASGAKRDPGKLITDFLKKGQIESKPVKGIGGFTRTGDNELLTQRALDAYGIKITNKAKAIDELGKSVGKDIGEAYTKHAKDFGKIFRADDLSSKLDDNLLNSISFEGKVNGQKLDPTEIRTYVTDFFNTRGKDGGLDANDLWKVVKDKREVFNKVSSGKSTKASDLLDAEIYKIAKQQLTESPALEGLRGLNRTYDAVNNTADATFTNRRQGATTRLPFFGSGVGNEAGIGVPVSNTANDLRVRLGNFLDSGAQPSSVANVKSKSADFLQNPRLAAILGPMVSSSMSGGGQPMEQGMPDPQTMGSEIPSAGDNGQAQIMQLLNSGVKPSEIKQLQDIGVLPKTKTNKDLSVTDRKTVAQAQSGVQALSDIANSLGQDQSLLLKSNLPGFLQDSQTKQYQSAITTAKEMIGRLQSGGAISDEEGKNFLSLLPSTFDDATTANQKLQRLSSQLNTILGVYSQ